MTHDFTPLFRTAIGFDRLASLANAELIYARGIAPERSRLART